MAPRVRVDVRINLSGLTQFRKIFERDLRRRTNGPIREMLHTWGDMYREWIHRRYLRYSRGEGNWQPLAALTVARKGHDLILRDTEYMRQTLEPTFKGKPGWLSRDVPFGVVVGFGSTAFHPTAKMPVDRLASIHQLGLGRVPARPIVVEPSVQLQRKMVEVGNETLSNMIDDLMT